MLETNLVTTILNKFDEILKEPEYQHEGDTWRTGICLAADILQEVFANEPVAKWEPPFGDWTNSMVLCSSCRIAIDKYEARHFNYCPYCGKKMIYLEEE